MATVFDDLIAEGTSLLSITSHIASFLTDRRSERTFLVETDAFFDYIDASLLAVRAFVEEAVAPGPNQSATKLLADFRDLKALEVVVTHIYRLVRQTCDADTLAIPYPIVAYVNELMQEIPLSTNARDSKILALATDELNFLHHRLGMLRRACEECRHLPSFPPNTGIIAFPYTERDSICLNSLLFHEVGHFLFQKSLVGNDLVSALHELVTKVQMIASPDTLFDRPVVAALALERVLSWCQELYCDLIGVGLAGPSYAIAFDRIYRLQGAGRDAEVRFSERYPPVLFRRTCIARMLQEQGWIDVVEEVDKERANWDFLQTTRAAISEGWVEGPASGGARESRTSTIDRTKYKYLLDNSGAAQVMVDSFFDVVPRVFEAVRKVTVHLKNYVDDFRNNYVRVTSSLLHLTVPEVSPDEIHKIKIGLVHPVTILSCGSLLLTTNLHPIHKLCGRDPVSITIEHRIWAEDRINRLVMKAVEDSLVLARWAQVSSK